MNLLKRIFRRESKVKVIIPRYDYWLEIRVDKTIKDDFTIKYLRELLDYFDPFERYAVAETAETIHVVFRGFGECTRNNMRAAFEGKPSVNILLWNE